MVLGQISSISADPVPACQIPDYQAGYLVIRISGTGIVHSKHRTHQKYLNQEDPRVQFFFANLALADNFLLPTVSGGG